MEKINGNITSVVDRIIGRCGVSVEAVIPILQEIQDTFHYLPEEALDYVCKVTNINPSRITGISTFYSQFRHSPAGEHTIKVCTGTACHVKGSTEVFDAIRRELDLKGFEDTDRTGKFTIEKVACLGCCTLAPVVKIDDITFGHVATGKAKDILKDFLRHKTTGRINGLDRLPGVPLLGEIRIGLGSCCIASGSEEVKRELEAFLRETKIPVGVKQVGCIGICNQVPVLEIIKPGEKAAFYAKVKPEDVRDIVLEHFAPKGILSRIRMNFSGLFLKAIEDGMPKGYSLFDTEQRDTPVAGFLDPQLSIATENRGVMKPCDYDEYERSEGFQALKQCLSQKTPQQVIDEILESGLRGRGGAGFPAGKKWQLVKDQTGEEKFIICNGDEGDPGAFMDRMLLESYPYRIIEGMLIAGYATGASHGIFYIRAEYPLAVRRIGEALEICKERGLIGKPAFGCDFLFNISIFEGAGAFVCGEETALIASMEGKRGHPRMRPPFPAIHGFKNKPTLVNNTETLALIPWIIRNGAKTFKEIGTKGSTGTKVFALAGRINRGGLIEVPMGTTIRQIVEEIGGGIAGDKTFKAVQIGGPSGGCIPASMADRPIDYEELTSAGAMMGSGGLIVLDDSDCMIDIAHYFLSFTQNQSCGKCTFCRIGTRRMLEMLEKIRNGKGTPQDLLELEKLALSTKKGSLCGLGKSAPNPVLSTLKYFREEYEAHLQGRCPAGKCKTLIRYEITEECIGCTRCAQECPSDAIAYLPYQVHHIDQEKCIKCDICRQICPVDAIKINS